jgi:septum formation protein
MSEIILASSSARRLALLQNISINPSKIISPNIDETRLPHEKPENMALRLAKAKAFAVASEYQDNAFIIAADTIVATKARIFDKANNEEEIRSYLNFYSGRRINIITAVSVISVKDGAINKSGSKVVVSQIKFKRISPEEMDNYLLSNLGIGNSGGINIESSGETLLQWIKGSYSGIIGLPLTETVNLLKGLGYGHSQGKC